MRKLTCLIIEDESLLAEVLAEYISQVPFLELKHIFSDGMSALEYLEANETDLIFIDINLPKLSGINFIKTLIHPPLVIFTTAYPEFAVEGFELNAVDYLLKPFSFERFLKAVNKVIEKLNTPVQNNIGGNNSFIFLKADKKNHKVDLETIHYIEAIGDYMKVITDTGQLIVNETMKKMQEELPASLFIRVHKSFIISRSKIRFIEGNFVQVADKSIPIGATYRNELLVSIEKKS